MSEPAASSTVDREELHTQLFANVVMQQASMALMSLGVTPHPQTGETMHDLEAAQHFIAQLEMLEAKTRGNLNADESAMLKQALTSARMAFVQSVERGGPPVGKKEAPTPPAAPPAETPAPEEPKPASDDERKKFVKKY